MARQDGKFIKGAAGPVVFKVYRGIQIVQSKPDFTPSSQTEPTKKAASAFGVASNFAMQIRDGLKALVLDLQDGEMVSRLNTEIIFSLQQLKNEETGLYDLKIPNGFSRLNGFEFNEKSPFRNNFLSQPGFDLTGDKLKISIPELTMGRDLKFQNATGLCVLNIAIGMYDYINGFYKRCEIQTQRFHADATISTAMDYEFIVEPGCLCVVAFSLQYLKSTFAGDFIVNSKTFHPAAIFRAVVAEGTADPLVTKKWKKMQNYDRAKQSYFRSDDAE